MVNPQLIYFIIVTILSIALSPKPPKPKPATLEDFDIPTADEDRPIPVVFGEVEITGSNLVWYGELFSKKRKKSGIFGSSTIGFAYYIGFHFILGHGPMDKISRITVGEKLAWEGDVTENEVDVLIDKRDLFGGKNKEGGMFGLVNFMMGEVDQAPDAYLGAVTPKNPAYRGVTGVVWRAQDGSGIVALINTQFGIVNGKQLSGLIGQTPYVKPWAFTVTRLLKGWHNDTVWYAEKAVIDDNSMNPAHIIYQCLTNAEWGMGRPSSSIDETTFEEAADTLFDEDFGLRLLWNRQSSVDGFIEIVLDHIGGALNFNRSTGKYQLDLIRGDYELEDLPLFDESNIGAVRGFQRQLWGETANEVTVVYTDPETFKETNVTAHDLANIQAQGARISQKMSYTGVYNRDIAVKLALRELISRSTPLAKISIETNRSAWPLLQGGVIKISWARLGLVEVVFRILTIRGGTLRDGMISIDLIEDIFGLPLSSYISPEDPSDPTEGADPDDDITPSNPGNVLATNLSTPPASPADGDRYLVPSTPPATGAWAGLEGALVEWDALQEFWDPVEVPPGQIIFDDDTGSHVGTDEDGDAVPPPWALPLTTKGDILVHDGTDLERLPVGTDGQTLKANSTQPTGLEWKTDLGGLRMVGAQWVRSGDAIDAADMNLVNVRVPYSGTIVRASIGTYGGTGDCEIDIWKDTHANFPPDVSDSIVAAAPPSITGGAKYEDTTLTGWNKTVTAGDWFVFYLDSSTVFELIVIELFIEES